MDSLSNSSLESLPCPKKPGPGGQLLNKMRDVIEVNESGAYCRMPRCQFVHRVYRASRFYDHFRNEHPEEAKRRGLFRNAGLFGVEQSRMILETISMAQPRPKIPLRQMVLEYISIDADGIHCELTNDEPKCNYMQQKFNHQNFARHFCKMHPFEASQKGFCRGFLEGVLEKKALKVSLKEATVERLKLRKAVLDYVARDEDGWHCRINGSGCPYGRKIFVTEKFRRHFRLKHPREAKQHGFFDSLVEPTPMQGSAKSWGVPKQRANYFRLDDEVETSTQSMDSSTTLQSDRSQEQEINLYQRTPNKDPSKYCRLCFSSTDILQPVFNRPDGTDLATLIEACTHVRLDPDEDHVSSICAGCWQKLNEIQHFQRQSQRLNEIVVRDREEAAVEEAREEEEPATFLVEMIKPEPSEWVEEETSIVLEGPPSEEDPVEELPYSQLRDGSFRCRLCKRSFQSLASMIDHLRSEHGEATPPVPSSSTDESEFRMVLVNTVPYYKCTDCDTLMRVRSNILRHWRRYHNNGEKKQKKWYCAESGCGQFFMECKAHKNHLEFFHGIRMMDYKASV